MKNKKRSLKVLLVLLSSLFLINSCFAAWIFLISDEADFQITSDGAAFTYGIGLSDPISDKTLDTTLGPQHVEEQFSFDNQGSERTLIMDFEIIKSDVEDNCIDWENDVSVSLETPAWIVGFQSGDSVLMRTGFNNYNIVIDAVAFSCPQDVAVSLALHE